MKVEYFFVYFKHIISRFKSFLSSVKAVVIASHNPKACVTSGDREGQRRKTGLVAIQNQQIAEDIKVNALSVRPVSGPGPLATVGWLCLCLLHKKLFL